MKLPKISNIGTVEHDGFQNGITIHLQFSPGEYMRRFHQTGAQDQAENLAIIRAIEKVFSVEFPAKISDAI